ncbi:hypothetical protein SEVIR_8G243600v4 [Setaria viridis]|uniref:Retrovirus-related Pol polyprotein from transposon TNT 1-94-like beta-barrel domain-containing protein n=1 Tax=Setaria viridis TaxID=4556 RepID=A0A4U6TJ12_SETVI|nr:uncharacterized protein LOC117866790 [Setaria viridis]TKW02428.1 hypothetical protein SEVIR_8G243600v2 [Setaria viridis]
MAEEGESEPLLPSQSRAAADTGGVLGGSGSFTWLTVLGFGFLTFNSAVAIYRSNGDKGSIAFVVASYLDLAALFVCLRLFERALPGFVTRKKLKGFVLATLRSPLPETTAGGGSSAQDPRDTAWSRARLIVDSGATGHAVGNILLLEGFQPYHPPKEGRVADGSRVRILGIGRIQRGNFSIPNVFLVEGVQDVLISTPQLDADHGLITCMGNGICKIMEADGTEVGGAIREVDRSYVLRYLEVPGTAQV